MFTVNGLVTLIYGINFGPTIEGPPAADFSAIGLDDFPFPKVDLDIIQLVFSRFGGNVALDQPIAHCPAKAMAKAIEVSTGSDGTIDMLSHGLVLSLSTYCNTLNITDSNLKKGWKEMTDTIVERDSGFEAWEKVAVMKALLTIPFQMLNDAVTNGLDLDESYLSEGGLPRGFWPVMLPAIENNVKFEVETHMDIILEIGQFLNLVTDNLLLVLDFVMIQAMNMFSMNDEQAKTIIQFIDKIWNADPEGEAEQTREHLRYVYDCVNSINHAHGRFMDDIFDIGAFGDAYDDNHDIINFGVIADIFDQFPQIQETNGQLVNTME